MIQLQKVCFQYGHSPALHDIDLQLPIGGLTVLCGVTGSGKSTLMRLLAGLEKPSAGNIRFAGDNASPAVSMVFQQPETQLFASSVKSDIEYGLAEYGVPKAQRPELIQAALEQVGLDPKTFSRRSPFLLSGGEKRRVCIAGALAVRPGLLILDEPTAGLDPAAASGLLQEVQRLRQSGLTLVVGTHDLDFFLPLADHVVVMSQGSVHYSGPIQPLHADPGQLRAAGLEPPAYMRIGQRLIDKGLLSAAPGSLAELLEGLQSRPLPPPGQDAAAKTPGSDAAADSAGARKTHRSATVRNSRAQNKAATGKLKWQELDPRVKWLGMVAGSLVILPMNSLLPLLLTAGMTVFLLLSARIPWRRTLSFFRPFLIMFLFLWLLSSLSWSSPDLRIGPLAFSYQGFIKGGLSILRFLLLILLSFLFTETTTGAPLREGLEWGIAPLKKLGIRTRNWSLAVSITLQFVPWIIGKLAQLQMALKSRGKPQRGFKQWTPRQISMLIVPLIILVISMGDELSTAIESRGYDPGKPRTPAYTLTWQRRDTFAVLYILLAVSLLWGCVQIT
jgi:energy-coupling factor transporter ATP-binding protein EcfA2/energy-coupling factor transporter transmembrane protein EcfT